MNTKMADEGGKPNSRVHNKLQGHGINQRPKGSHFQVSQVTTGNNEKNVNEFGEFGLSHFITFFYPFFIYPSINFVTF